jgi:hypothetical protein
LIPVTSLPPELKKKQLQAIISLSWFLIGIPAVFSVIVYIYWIVRGEPVPPTVIWIPLTFPLFGLFLLAVNSYQAFWSSNRYYLSVATLRPNSNDEFIDDCQRLCEEAVDPSLAVDVRKTIEEALFLPKGVLFAQTDLMRFGSWGFGFCNKAIKEQYNISIDEIRYRHLRCRFLSEYVNAVRTILRSRASEKEQETSGETLGENEESSEPTQQSLTQVDQNESWDRTSTILAVPKLWVQLRAVSSAWLALGLFLGVVLGTIWLVTRNDKTFFLMFYVAAGVLGVPVLLVFLFICFSMRQFLFDRESRSVTIYYKFMGLIPIFRKQVAFDQFVAVRYHSWTNYFTVSPKSEDMRYVVLASRQGKDWWVGMDKNYLNNQPCSKSDAKRISIQMELPYEESNMPPNL